MGADLGRRNLLLTAAASVAQRSLAADVPAPRIERIDWLLAAGDTDVQQLVARQMPDVQQSIARGNIKRIWKALAEGEPICTADVFMRREFADKVYFSPTQLALPPVLIVWPSKLSTLPRNAQGAVQLQSLLARAELQGVAVAGRNYGDEINAMIQSRPRRNTLKLLESTRSVARAAEMLLVRRVDYLIGYSMDLDEADAAVRQTLTGLKPAMLPIEGATALAPAGVVCPRTPWGIAAMRRIDLALSSRESVLALQQIQDGYMPEAERRRHGSELDAFFRARSRPMALLDEPR